MSFTDLLLQAAAQRSGRNAPKAAARKPAARLLTTVLTVAGVGLFIAFNSTMRPRTNQSPATPPPAGVSSSAAKPQGTAQGAADDPESKPLSQYQTPRSGAGGDDSTALMFRVGLDLAIVVGFALLCAAGWRKLRASGARANTDSLVDVSVTQTVELAAQRYLHVVEIQGRRMILASTPQQVTCISIGSPEPQIEECEPAPAAEDTAAEPAGEDWFSNVLARLDSQQSWHVEPTGEAVAVTAAPAVTAPVRTKASLFQHVGSGANGASR